MIWPDGAIVNTWLEVTLKADAATGLSVPDVFYFGNQIGETGNDPGNTFVDAGDFVAVRDHPANFLNRAQPGNAYDFNHDSFVDGADLVITRDNPNSFLTAIKLIAPPAAAAPAASVPSAAVPAAGPTASSAVSDTVAAASKQALPAPQQPPATSTSALAIPVSTQPRNPRRRWSVFSSRVSLWP